MINPTLEYRQEHLTADQIEKAANVRRDLYPEKMPCMRCGYMWMTHKGLLCPVKEGSYSKIMNPLTGMPYPIPPQYGDQTFLPDEEYYKPPDFEVM